MAFGVLACSPARVELGPDATPSPAALDPLKAEESAELNLENAEESPKSELAGLDPALWVGGGGGGGGGLLFGGGFGCALTPGG